MRNPRTNKMVIVLAAAPGHRAVCMRITGDVDLVGESDLTSVALKLTVTPCWAVLVDLDGITFAGATLINFLFRLTTQLPEQPMVILCRPSPMTRRMIELTALDDVAMVRGDLPPEWMPHSAAPVGAGGTPPRR